MYALNLDADKQILSVCECVEGMEYDITVETFPKGDDVDITDYKYIDGEFIPNPKPKPDSPKSTAEEDTLSMLVDHEERLLMLELGITEE